MCLEVNLTPVIYFFLNAVTDSSPSQIPIFIDHILTVPTYEHSFFTTWYSESYKLRTAEFIKSFGGASVKLSSGSSILLKE